MSFPPLVINVALTGMVPAKAVNPNVPVTPDEIADDAARCDDVIVCVSASGRRMSDLEKRAEVLDLEGDLAPELASLNFPTQASANDPATIRGLAERMRERGIVPELEVFDLGMVDYARYLLDKRVLAPPLCFNILLGNLGTVAATPANLATVVRALPEGATWAAAGIGRIQEAVSVLAVETGGHVRTGLEDNLWLDTAKTRPADNVSLVERVVGVAQSIERGIATPAQARELFRLPTQHANA